MLASTTEINTTPEVNKYTHPKEYFLVQIELAKKIVELGLAKDLNEAIIKYTAIYRRITDKKYNPDQTEPAWQDLESKLDSNSSTRQALEIIWNSYVSNDENKYKDETKDDGHHFGSFVYKDEIDKQTQQPKISLHFNVRNRGKLKSDFSRQFNEERQADLTEMFTAIKKRFLEDKSYRPQTITLGSWMNNLPGVKDVLPPEFVKSAKVVYPPDISFNGDSMWGQFLKLDGNAYTQRVQEYLEKVSSAKSLNDLVEALPIPVVLFQGKIEDFFNHYGIK
ncbi:hypothetical protein A2572_04155 [Candidatus Collierbacteria bacterium RIFOXYD1_FULL_40_9]|uniref:Uncharacterized protein n=1 Tax=Candidatus Collierbacteria bacterium RIFOXYD1_FULL_40_9 TaxID=1817731 RepID=A0A1F5FPM8_9BACT|nr:MAG: hypothetical protein A2572_04155 [Candidatus Collierbacteria bacterium RIFOXYD1_FULL_40_9]